MATRLLNFKDAILAALVYYLLFFYGIFSIAFSGEFYRIQIGVISPSEIMLALSLILLILYKKLYRCAGVYFYSMFVLWFLWFLGSFLIEGREWYFILRQGMSVPYLIFAPILLMAMNFKVIKPGSIEYVLFLTAVISGVVLNFGHMDVAIPLLLWLLFLTDALSFLAVLSVIVAFVFTGHASHKLALVIYLTVRYMKYWIRYLPVIIIISSIFVLYFINHLYKTGELTDVNAMWRYIYWSDMMKYMTKDFRWLSGVGYGIPYINPEFENFRLLFGQIESGKGEFQIYAVPPHNSFLVSFYHLGIAGFLLGIVIWFKPLFLALKILHFNSIGVLIGVLFIMLTHNAMELPYTAIYCSAILASVVKKVGGKVGG